MYHKTEIHRNFVYAFADIQNPKHMPKIRFSLNNHISAEAPIEKMYYEIEIHRRFVYAFAESIAAGCALHQPLPQTISLS